MNLRDQFQRGLARQLSRPEGLRGRVVARRLNQRNLAMVRTAVRACSLGTGDHAVDVGFGGGVGLSLLLGEVLPGGHVLGADISDTMIARARQRYAADVAAGSLTLQQCSIAELPAADASVDGLITVNTIYFVDDLPAACAEMARVLRPGGRAAVGVGDPDHLASLPLTAHGFVLRPVADVGSALSAAGLAVAEDLRGGAGGSAYHCLVAERT